MVDFRLVLLPTGAEKLEWGKKLVSQKSLWLSSPSDESRLNEIEATESERRKEERREAHRPRAGPVQIRKGEATARLPLR